MIYFLKEHETIEILTEIKHHKHENKQDEIEFNSQSKLDTKSDLNESSIQVEINDKEASDLINTGLVQDSMKAYLESLAKIAVSSSERRVETVSDQEEDVTSVQETITYQLKKNGNFYHGSFYTLF